MPAQIAERSCTIDERAELERILSSMPSPARRWALGAANAIVMWSVLMLGVVIVWLLLAWVARKFAAVEFGWDSPHAQWVLGLGTLVAAAIALVSSVRWVRRWQSPASALRRDLAGGKVLEEHYRFSAAKRFQEPEHGGLLYCLRTADDRVLVLFDHESQDLGVEGQDPLKSSFSPRAELLLARAPRTRLVLGRHFCGAVLDAGAPLELTARPSRWPDPDECSKYKWDDLEKRLASTQGARNPL